MSTKKTPLGGIPITRKEAFAGLGDPKTWQKESAAVYAEFNAKPKLARESIISVAVGKLMKIHKAAGRKAEPVYAKPLKGKAAKARSTKAKRPKRK